MLINVIKVVQRLYYKYLFTTKVINDYFCSQVTY